MILGVAHIVFGLLVFVAFLVSSGLLLIWLALLLAQGLPSVTKDFANLTYNIMSADHLGLGALSLPKLIPGFSSRTLSRWSLAKNMYAERPRLGALGSRKISHADQECGALAQTLLLLLSTTSLGLGSLCACFRHVDLSVKLVGWLLTRCWLV